MNVDPADRPDPAGPAPRSAPPLTEAAAAARAGSAGHGDPSADAPGQGAQNGDGPSGDDSHAKRRGPGRNLPAAIGVGLGMGALLLLSLFVVPPAFPVLVAAVLVLAVLELTRALAQGGLRVPTVPILVGAVGMVVSTVVFGVDGLVIATAVVICVLILWRVSESLGLPALRDVSAGAFTVAWVPFLGCFTLLLQDHEDGGFRVLLAILIAVGNDVGGYAAGVLFGSHPMVPSISPKKSWEGFAGSLILGLASAIAVVVLALDGQWWVGAIVGSAVVVVSTGGDLAESLLKRDLGLKDMGHLLPGHGGMLDRIDAMLLAAPSTYILLEILLP